MFVGLRKRVLLYDDNGIEFEVWERVPCQAFRMVGELDYRSGWHVAKRPMKISNLLHNGGNI
jgi:hypothetical protein